MAAGQQYRTYDFAGEDYADGGVPGILEYVSGGGAVGRYPGSGTDVLEENFSFSF